MHEHLELAGRQLGTLSFYNLDAWLLLAGIVLLALGLLFCALRSVLRFALRGVRKSKKE